MTMVLTVSRVVFTAVLKLFPREFAVIHGQEMIDAFCAEIDRRSREQGALATTIYAVRAVCDAAP